MSISVVIVDDHDVVRNGISRLLTDIEGIDVLAEASSGEQGVDCVRDLQPDVVLMDVRMPGMGGIEATRRILRHSPDTRIVALSAVMEEPFPTRLLEAGAQGYLGKGASIDEIVLAVRTVYSGQRYLSQGVAQNMALNGIKKKEVKNPFDALSERELQISLLIANCARVSDIAEQIAVSPKTVNSYRYRVFEKLEVSGDVELTKLAIRYGMIESPSDSF